MAGFLASREAENFCEMLSIDRNLTSASILLTSVFSGWGGGCSLLTLFLVRWDIQTKI